MPRQPNVFEHGTVVVKYTIIELAADITSDLCALTMLTCRVCMNLLRMLIISDSINIFKFEAFENIAKLDTNAVLILRYMLFNSILIN